MIGSRARYGRLAQLVERLPYKQDVTGSSPVSPIAVLTTEGVLHYGTLYVHRPIDRHLG